MPTNINARGEIEVNGDIRTARKVNAGDGILATGGITAHDGILSGGNIRAVTGDINTNKGIKARLGITARRYINATDGGIEAGRGVMAGLSISAKFIDVKLRIFAGLCDWKTPSNKEQEIKSLIISGTVCSGTVVKPKS